MRVAARPPLASQTNKNNKTIKLPRAWMIYDRSPCLLPLPPGPCCPLARLGRAVRVGCVGLCCLAVFGCPCSPPLKRELDLFDDLSRRPSRGFCNSLCTAGEPIKCNSSKSNCQCCSPLVLDSRERSVPKRLPRGSWIQDAPPWQAPDWSQRDPVT